MALNRKITKQTKPTKPKVSRKTAKSFDEKCYGSEPFVVDTSNSSAYCNALNWYNYGLARSYNDER